jgi:hypothetical protein
VRGPFSLPPSLGVGELARHLAARIPLGDVAPAVVELLAPRQAQLDLGAAASGDVQPERDERQALGPEPALQLVDLGPVEEELAVPLRLMAPAVGLSEWRDVGADQPRLIVLDPGVRVGQVDLAGPDRLDLGPGEGEACLERLGDRELVASPSIDGNGLGGQRTDSFGGLDARTPARCGPASESAFPPAGSRLDGHLLRGGAATG